MAKIKLVAPVGDIRGQMGGIVYSNWRGQAYTRRLATSVSNPHSLNQQLVRDILDALSGTWLSELTVAQRAAWNEYAQIRGSASGDDKQVSRGSLIKPLGKLLSGKNCFIGCNVGLAKAGLAKIEDAPLGINTPGNPTNLAAVFTPGGAPVFDLTWDDAADMGANDKVVVWVTCPGVFHKQQIAAVAKAAETIEFPTLRSTNGESIPLVKGLYRMQVATMDAFGQRSAGGNVVEYNVTSLT